MRRRKRKQKDEAQSSLDRFSDPQAGVDSPEAPAVPSMPDLDRLEAAEARLDGHAPKPTPPETSLGPGPRQFSMPSAEPSKTRPLPATTMTYHDLNVLYPHAPVPAYDGEMVLHNSTLLDLTGCGTLMDWVADGHGCIVEMKRMMKRPTEFNQALGMLSEFIEGDAQGQIIRITDTRLMFLPRGCRGIKGTDMEGFAVSPDELMDVYE
ncbi:MAG: hypothetical protein DWC10_04545 [Candidatus Poseidoniales archaeon]|nr:MAG: hypothetical protein DWC10_04545 [Candidatus Poseidoniales archaeon]